MAIVIHNYRWRQGLAQGEKKYDDLERRLAEFPVVNVPILTVEGDANGAPHLEPSSYARKFAGKYLHRSLLGGIGHNLPQDASQAFVNAVIEVDGYRGRLELPFLVGVLSAVETKTRPRIERDSRPRGYWVPRRD